MNIFFVDRDPRLAARALHDKHVVKMILETAQLLSTAHHVHGTWHGLLLQPTHVNHPSAVWCRDRWENYDWLATHGMELCQEYTHRYSKRHSLSEVMFLLGLEYPMEDDLPFVPPPQCMPDIYKQDDTVQAYRAYYRATKLTYTMRFKKYRNRWTRREKPTWLSA